MRTFFLFFLLAFPAVAQEQQAFYGEWGTSKQCARTPLKSGGSVLAQPFEINDRWLKQGKLWCSLNWGPIEERKKGLFTGAHVQCGEDAVRGYFLGMELVADKLTLRWNFPHSNGPLARCSKP